MAQKTVIDLVDDIDGSPAEYTVQFGLDGVTYEIDLSPENAEALHAAFAPYVEKGRRVGGRVKLRSIGGGRGAGNSPTGGDAGVIREWALENGYGLSDRGRIPNDVVTAYNEAQAAPAEKAAEPKPTKKPRARAKRVG